MATATFHITSYDASNINIDSWSSGYPASNCYNKDETSTTYAQWLAKQANSTTCYVYFKFDTSDLPENITINFVQMVVKHGFTTQYPKNNSGYESSGVQMASGTVDKGSLEEPFSESAKTGTVTTTLSGEDWTREELRDARLKVVHVTDSRYGSQDSKGQLNIYGATLTVDYEESTPVGDSHTLTLSLSGANLVSNHKRGAQTIYEGRDESISFIPIEIDGQVRVYDNDVDVTSSLTAQSISNSLNVSNITTSYGFTYDSSSGYWKSNNKGKAKTSAVSRVSISLIQDSTVRFTVVNYSEAGYDFGILGKPDIAINTEWNTDTVGYWNGSDSSKNISTPQTVDYFLSAGDHFIDVKYIKDDATDSNNDAFWFRCEIDPDTSETNNRYTYLLQNIEEDHNIRIICGDSSNNLSVISSGDNVYLMPSGESAVYKGSDYELQVRLSDDDYYIDKVTDNNVDVTSSVVPPHRMPDPSYTVTSVDGASYTFTLSSSTGYYTSNNKGVANSAALCKVNISSPVRCRLTFNYINYAQATYDFGIFGEVDASLRTDYATDTSGYALKCDTSTYNKSSVQTLVYDLEAGDHFIQVKYKKNGYTNSNNDTLQFKVDIVPLESLDVDHYTYFLSNVTTQHNIIVITKKIPVYEVNISSSVHGTVDPTGVAYVRSGESLSLSFIADTNYQAKRLYIDSVQTSFENDSFTIQNVDRDMNVYVLFTSGSISLHVKDSSVNWSSVQQSWKKVNGRWVTVEFSDIGDPNTKFVRKNS